MSRVTKRPPPPRRAAEAPAPPPLTVTVALTPAEPTVTIALKDLGKVCHVCGALDPAVRLRTYYTADYQGPCGDSFCYASCTMTTCRPITLPACETCVARRKAPPR